jgi:hypothetical protein
MITSLLLVRDMTKEKDIIFLKPSKFSCNLAMNPRDDPSVGIKVRWEVK